MTVPSLLDTAPIPCTGLPLAFGHAEASVPAQTDHMFSRYPIEAELIQSVAAHQSAARFAEAMVGCKGLHSAQTYGPDCLLVVSVMFLIIIHEAHGTGDHLRE